MVVYCLYTGSFVLWAAPLERVTYVIRSRGLELGLVVGLTTSNLA